MKKSAYFLLLLCACSTNPYNFDTLNKNAKLYSEIIKKGIENVPDGWYKDISYCNFFKYYKENGEAGKDLYTLCNTDFVNFIDVKNGKVDKELWFYNKQLTSIFENTDNVDKGKKFFDNGNIFKEWDRSNHMSLIYYINGQIAHELRKEGMFYYDKDGKLLFQYNNELEKYVDKDNIPLNTTIKAPCYNDLSRICYSVSFKDGIKNGMEIDINFVPHTYIREPIYTINHYDNGKLTYYEQTSISDTVGMVDNNKIYYYDNGNVSFSNDYTLTGEKKLSVQCNYKGIVKGQQALEIYEKFKADPSKHPCPLSK